LPVGQVNRGEGPVFTARLGEHRHGMRLIA
jgi:hypothetical protein